MREDRQRNQVFSAGLWLLVAAALAFAWKKMQGPNPPPALKKIQKILTPKPAPKPVGSQDPKHPLLRLDGFSGYSVLRAPEFHAKLTSQGMGLRIQDDQADLSGRYQALIDGQADYAVFTIDSFLSAASRTGRWPASIVLVLDETQGADAIVVSSGGPKDLEDLNHPDGRFVLTPDSPSEFLARVVRAHFRLEKMPADPFVSANGSSQVLEAFSKAPKKNRSAYVMWEPDVSVAISKGGRKLLDSSKLKGMIVDCLVVRKQVLRERPKEVQAVVASILDQVEEFSKRPQGMAGLLEQDSIQAGDPMTSKTAHQVADGILFKNAMENFAHFELVQTNETQGLPSVSTMAENVVQVLVGTGALPKSPLPGSPGDLVESSVLAAIKKERVRSGPAGSHGIRKGRDLGKLDDAQWSKLQPVGDVRVAPLSFGRGTARLNISAKRELSKLRTILETWPQYYLLVTGHARAEGDPEANRILAHERAKAAGQFLLDEGLPPDRMRIRAARPSDKGGQSQSVRFQLGQAP